MLERAGADSDPLQLKDMLHMSASFNWFPQWISTVLNWTAYSQLNKFMLHCDK
jgi:hypothetical protein